MKLGLSFIVVSLLACAPALAEDRGSVEDQLACTPDVYRLCSQHIPNEDAIVSCLRKSLPRLSPGCQRVFSEPAHRQSGGETSDD